MKGETEKNVEAIIFDWAGTIVDFGSFAPTQVFVEAFAEFGVNISLAEARGPMGVAKWDHIRQLCNEAKISEQYSDKFGHAPTDEDVTEIYNRFMPLQLKKIALYSKLIPGALDTITELRESGIKMGSCSGYPRDIMQKVIRSASEDGLVMDYVVASDQVVKGRPLPSQALANVVALSIEDVKNCVKVDDTCPGIFEGRRAGMWTVALTCSGNSMGLTYGAFKNLSKPELEKRRKEVGEIFKESKPHYLIDTIADLPHVIDDINKRISRGDVPQAS